MDFLIAYEFQKCVSRYRGDHKVQNFFLQLRCLRRCNPERLPSMQVAVSKAPNTVLARASRLLALPIQQ